MTDKRLLEKLLRIKGFRVSWYNIHSRKKEIHIGVKPHKTGCCCPYCDRRGEIVAISPECREWQDVTICGMRVFFLSTQRD